MTGGERKLTLWLCTGSCAKSMHFGHQAGLKLYAVIPLNARAHAEDLRSGCRPQRQPQHAPCVGASFRLSQAAALARQAPPLHARRDRRAARRAAGGAVDLVGDLARAGVGRGRHPRARRRARGLRAGAGRRRDGGARSRCAPSSARSRRSCCRRWSEIGDRHGTDSRALGLRRPLGRRVAAARAAPVAAAVPPARGARSATPRATSSTRTRSRSGRWSCAPSRVGLRTLTLPVTGLAGLGDVLARLRAAGRRHRRRRGGRRRRRALGLPACAPPPAPCRCCCSAAPVAATARARPAPAIWRPHRRSPPSQLLDLVEGGSREAAGGEDARGARRPRAARRRPGAGCPPKV